MGLVQANALALMSIKLAAELNGMSDSSQYVRKLGYLARRNLAAVLDHSSPRGADWKGLADRMGFTYDTVRLLRAKESPTLALLEEWETKKGTCRFRPP